MIQRPTHDHPRPFCGQGCPAFGDTFARYPSLAKPTPKPRKAPSRLRSKPHRISSSVRDHVFVRDNFTCRWCEVPGGALDAHHILARSQGGKDRVTNLVSLHRLCHMQVHANPSEARRRGLIVATGGKG